MSSDARSELALVAAVVSGDSGAATRFLDFACPILWSVVQKLQGAGPEARSAFLEIIAALKANGHARLRAFDGRARLSTYLALVARDVLSDKLAHLVVEAPGEAWSAFERFFEADVLRRIAQRFPREEAAWPDIYQDICLKLVEDDFRRLRAYDGHGSFVGYVLTVVERILIDHVRRYAPRRRLPAAVARLSSLDREIYMAVVWKSCPADPERLAAALRGRFDRDPEPLEIRRSVERVSGVARLAPGEVSGRGEMIPLDRLTENGEGKLLADGSPNPEEHLLLREEERSRAELLVAVRLAAAELPAEERCYLQTIFSATDPLPPREIARIMGCKVEEVYRLRQRARRWMKEIADHLVESRVRPSELRNGDLDHGTASTRAN